MQISLKFKLLISFLLLVAIPIIILGYMSYDMASDSLQATIEQGLRDDTKLTAEAIERTLKASEDILKVASMNSFLDEAVLKMDEENKIKAFNYLNELQREHKDLIEMLILVDTKGKTVCTNESLTSSVNLSNRDYIQRATKGVEVISDVVFSKFTNEPVVAIGKPLKVDDKVVGVLVGTIKFEKISGHAAEIKVGENGYAYMLDKQGLIVYHPKKEKILKENLGNTDNQGLKKLVGKMKAGKTDEGFYTYEGVYKFIRFQPAGNWVVAITANYDEYMAAAYKIKKDTLIIIGVSLLVALTLAFIISSNIINPIKQLQNLMAKAGNGDLTVKANIKTRDEIKNLADSFNKMIGSQLGIVGQVRKGAQELAASSEEMAASAEQVSSATQEISTSIQQVAQDADKQNSTVVDASQALVQLSSLVQLAQSKALTVNKSSEDTMETAQEGRTKVKETVQAIHIINEKSQDTANVVQELNQLSAQVGEIITPIHSIPDQTNLLALNAAIEAARAGEHGRGFAVVAEEVRKLAEESNKGANEIATLVHEMIKHTEKAVQSMDQGKQAVENGVAIVNSTDQAFAKIIKAVEETVKNVKEIVEVTKEEVATSDQVVGLIDLVATITENTATNSQEVSAAAEEQTAAVETVASGSEQISALANSLEEMVRKFKLE